MRNAIPREAFATLAVERHKVDALKSAALHFQAVLLNELGSKEKHIVLQTEPVAQQAEALSAECRDRFINLLNSTPNGVIRNSDVAKGVVETSLNVGVVSMDQANAEIICLIRSLIDTGREWVVETLTSLGALAGVPTAP